MKIASANRPGEHRQGRTDDPQRPALAADDAAEGVHRSAVRHEPRGLPAASDIATVIVHTPLLDVPLVGPAYFVSHGDEAFPDVEIILQGESVKLDRDGHTHIKSGITYSRFETVPDAPFTSFEFNAPEGPYCIFAANANLCQSKSDADDNHRAERRPIKQSTQIGVTGCPKVHKAKKKAKHRKKHRKAKAKHQAKGKK